MGRAWDDAKLMGYAYAYDQVQHGHQETTQAPPLRYDPSVTPRTIVIEKPVPSVTTPPKPDPSSNAPTPTARRVAIKVSLAKQATVRGGKVRFLLRNASSAKLTGTVTLRAKIGKRTIVLGTGKVSLAAGKRGTLTVTLTRAARRALGRRAQLAATATYALKKRDRREGDEKGGADDRAEVGPARGIGSAAE